MVFVWNIFRYDTKTDSWTFVAPVSGVRDAVGLGVLDDRIYAVGGYNGTHNLDDVEAYDAEDDEWKQVHFFRLMLPSLL